MSNDVLQTSANIRSNVRMHVVVDPEFSFFSLSHIVVLTFLSKHFSSKTFPINLKVGWSEEIAVLLAFFLKGQSLHTSPPAV